MSASPPPPGVDTTVPSPARIYDYLLGGRQHYAVDRHAAERILRLTPGSRTVARNNREFLRRVVVYMAHEGIGQFLDIGSGLPTADNVHEVAQRAIPDARVMYVDNDPSVLMHARALLGDTSRTQFVHADTRDTAGILTSAHGFLDLSRPVGLLLVSILPFIPDEDDPAGVVSALVGRLAPGSLVAVSHITDEGMDQAVLAQIEASYAGAAATPALRSREAIAAFLGGLDLVDPGLVEVEDWRPERVAQRCVPPVLGAVGRHRL
jgi:hypothetical protein